MKCRIGVNFWTVVVWILWMAAGEALAQGGDTPQQRASEPADPPHLVASRPLRLHVPASIFADALDLPLDGFPVGFRPGVQLVLEQPTLAIKGPTEIFRGSPVLYRWFLDHPEQAMLTWRRLGARCTDITRQGPDRFRWTDGQGSVVSWDTIWRGPHLRVWYAEGHARPGPLLPAVPLRAIAVFRFTDGFDYAGHTFVEHQADIFLQTDSKTAALITRLLGSSAPRLARRGAAQIEMFFSALVWFLDHHPERVERLQLGSLVAESPTSRDVH